MAWHLIDPGKPTQNAKGKSLNGRVRDELINPNIFRTIGGVTEIAEVFHSDFRDVRPHSIIGYLKLSAFAAKFKIT